MDGWGFPIFMVLLFMAAPAAAYSVGLACLLFFVGGWAWYFWSTRAPRQPKPSKRDAHLARIREDNARRNAA